MEEVDELFAYHKLNAVGQVKAGEIARHFSTLKRQLVALGPSGGGRSMALVFTHLEQACFHAKKAMAAQPENQES